MSTPLNNQLVFAQPGHAQNMTNQFISQNPGQQYSAQNPLQKSAFQGSTTSDWAADFATKLNIVDQQTSGMGFQQPSFQPMYSSSVGLSQAQASAAPQVETQVNQKLFEAAFDNIEREINAAPVAQSVEVESHKDADVADPEAKENEELSKIATHIVNNIQGSEKLGNSKFMELMQHLSQRTMKLEGDGFVHTGSGPIAGSSTTGQLDNPLVSEAPLPPTIAQTTGLPDPLDFIPDPQKLNNKDKIYSPLEMAQMFAPGVPHPSSWEEKYDDF